MGVLLGKQRNPVLSEDESEILVHESRAECAANAIRDLDRQLRAQDIEIYHGDQEYEALRREQTWLRAELQSREKAPRDARINTVQDVEELTEVCCARAEGTREFREDDFPDTNCRKASPQCLRFKFRNCEIEYMFRMTLKILRILKRPAAPDHSTFLDILSLFRVFEEASRRC